MKTIIVSDTHGQDRNLLKVVQMEKPISKIVHLGDIGDLEDYIETATGCPCFMVKGNNDWNSFLPGENVIMMGKHRTFITHGHYYGVSYSHREIIRHARALECDTIMYGHTHVPELVEDEGFLIMNPGSLTYPRQIGKKPSYIVAEVQENGDVSYEIKYL